MERSMMKLSALVGLAIGISATAAAQTLTPVQIKRIDSVFAQFDGTNRPGCAVGVGQAGLPTYLRGYGMSDLQHGVPITPQSIFHVASVSKQFTAFAVGLLAQDGKLSLDDEVRKYLPELPDYGKKITLRHLIYHTSGIRDQWELLGMAGWRYPDDLFTQEDVLDIVVRQKELNFSPGDEYVYSNSGYSLLAIIVQRVSGKSLREFADRRIFQQLGMANTHFTVFGTPVEFAGPAGAVPVAVKIAATGDSMLRIPAFHPPPAQLAEFAGEYWSDELRVTYRVDLKDSGLVVHPFKHPAKPLRPAFADAFVAGDAGTIRFVRTKGRVTGFRLTGGRVRNVAFVKGR